MSDKLKVLFLCTGNSCRSQMAEGWARHLRGDVIEPYSAGVKKTELNPYAAKVMWEAGVDITDQHSKLVDEVMDAGIDVVVTVCQHAHDTCPMFPGEAKVVHRGFDDPPALTADIEGQEEKLEVYRRVRDEIKAYIETLPQAIA